MVKKKILIVEDEFITALDLKFILKGIGYEVQFISGGDEAIELAEKERPNLVLMDINIGGERDGISIAEKIYSNLKIPIIFMTGYNAEDMIERAESSKPVAILSKPIDIDMLKAAINSVFERVSSP